MEKLALLEAFAAIAQITRLDALRLLLNHSPEGLPSGDIGRLLDIPQNTMSSHLNVLKRAGLVQTQRAGTTIIYRPNTELVWRLVEFLATDFTPLVDRSPAIGVTPPHEAPRVFNVLFLCRANSVRSIMAEAILRKMAPTRFNAFSAGNLPAEGVHPMTLVTLQKMDCPVVDLRPKSWDEFRGVDRIAMDFVFTVCDTLTGEQCPSWPGQPFTAHWAIDDPSLVKGSELQRLAAFRSAAGALTNRLSVFTALPIKSIDRMSLQSQLKAIGNTAG
ncbi:arsenate reductase [Brucella sp. NBRC 13694]|jgi:protein-tyrosine-phosphatase/DNA-binding transcriptional ArsR family regulator|uniref:metalloregulator ArsR/SmtB family transcription factor n=1 Tax=Brucella TaxID=234 RepID=UPI000F68F80B|nr:metalloregulator ArsR/SmtB family transcription factor [Brucella anthropi]MCR5943653.1 metalloregulator ArsR/SmtB family transcription factor [Ochrobactrum sp. XJ1]RRY16058.1 ArsR family transcriptional regulator [Brucella anthropi]